MKFFKGTPPKPSPRYAKLAHDLRENGLWVENDDFQLLDAVRDLCACRARSRYGTVTLRLYYSPSFSPLLGWIL